MNQVLTAQIGWMHNSEMVTFGENYKLVFLLLFKHF